MSIRVRTARSLSIATEAFFSFLMVSDALSVQAGRIDVVLQRMQPLPTPKTSLGQPAPTDPLCEGWGIDNIIAGRLAVIRESDGRVHVLKAGDTIPKKDPDAHHVLHAIEQDRVFIIREDGIMGWVNKNGNVELTNCPPSEIALPSQNNHDDDLQVAPTDESEKQRVAREESPVVYVDDSFLEENPEGFETILESINFEEQTLREMACLLSAYGEVTINVRGTLPPTKVDLSIERPKTIRESLSLLAHLNNLQVDYYPGGAIIWNATEEITPFSPSVSPPSSPEDETGLNEIIESIHFENQPLREVVSLLATYGQVDINVRRTVPSTHVWLQIEEPCTVHEVLDLLAHLYDLQIDYLPNGAIIWPASEEMVPFNPPRLEPGRGGETTGLNRTMESIAFGDSPLREVVALLSAYAQAEILVDKSVPPTRVTIGIQHPTTVRDMLARLCHLYDLEVDYGPNGAVIRRGSAEWDD